MPGQEPYAQVELAGGEGEAGSPRERAEVRDVLAWMRLLVDPHDAAAVVRALARPPIELRQVELARVIQVARRRTPFGGTLRGGRPSLREDTPFGGAPPLGAYPEGHRQAGRQAGRLDLVAGLAAATESPHVPPEARERIQRFLELHAAVSAELHSVPPQVFLDGLIRRLRVGRWALLAPRAAGEHGGGLDQLQQLAAEFLASEPHASTRNLVRHLAAGVPRAQRPARCADASPGRAREQGDDELHATLQLLRREVLDGVARIGGRLGELRLDTDLDISHGVVRYLELLKLSALAQRPPDQSLADALADLNARLLAAATPLQREILLTSTLDHALLGAEEPRSSAIAPREQHSLGPFLPRKGAGLALSASDIHTYRSCPLRYKYARVLRIPVQPSVHQRFGIVVHQVLERYHAQGGRALEQLLRLLDACWLRAGFGEDGLDGELCQKARHALTRYHARLGAQASEPVWFERPFSFRLGPHHLRGRVDRVDRLAAGADARYELIDYKTSRPKSPGELSQDIQLSLYALAAQEDWQLESSRQAYHYVLDDLQVPVTLGEHNAESVKEVVLRVGAGILAQEFDPTPSPATCSMCDYRIVCPAAEA